MSLIERLSIGGIDLGYLFVKVAVVRAHKFIFGCRLELTISLDGILPLGMFYRSSMKHSLFLDLYDCDHRHVQTYPGVISMHAPRGSNCGSPRVAKGRGSSLADR